MPDDSRRAGGLLRVATCGSVDDGKSTLIGRLLFDLGTVPEDQLAALVRDSRGRTSGPEGLDFSLLVDGLEAEREQGITIDVAYRYLTTPARQVILIDSPGHQQYTRNMATAAANADAAIVLLDARKGVLTQTRRHAVILSLMGIRTIAVAINKMDLVDHDRGVFEALKADVEHVFAKLGAPVPVALPVSGLTGANVVRRSREMTWYEGPTLGDWLEGAGAGEQDGGAPFRMPVQWVNRAGQDFRGLSGTVASGRIRPGDSIASSRPDSASVVDRIVTMDGDLGEASAGQAVTIVLRDPVDLGRGDVLFPPDLPPEIADQFTATVVWFADEPLVPHRSYLMRIGTTLLAAEVSRLRHRLDLDTLDTRPAETLGLNDVGSCNFALAARVAFEPYRDNPDLGSFLLIDRVTRATSGIGFIEHGLRRGTNLHAQTFAVTPETRARQMGQTPAIVWFTGLSGAGKSTVADRVEQRLAAEGRHSFILDGDNVRGRLNRDLGFSEADRVENIRRVAEVARLMADAGLIVLVSLISPYRLERQMAREIAGEMTFIEVFVDAPVETCERRDVKGLYAKARAGRIPNFTGISSPYEPPLSPDLHLETAREDIETCAERVVSRLRGRVG